MELLPPQKALLHGLNISFEENTYLCALDKISRMTLEQLHNLYVDSLSCVYDTPEGESIFYITLESVAGFSRLKYSLEKVRNAGQEIEKILLSHLERLKKGEPVQYVLGEAYFYGRIFSVTPSTLIPRGETEELVQMVLRDAPLGRKKVMDIGTGSGAIAISLALECPAWDVTAVDISTDALAVARKNARRLGAQVRFLQCDILDEKMWEQCDIYDVVVSNPPYVRVMEKPLMRANVLDFEPSLALFVPDEDPLLFYRKIALFSEKHLRSGGMLFFEINEFLGVQMLEMLSMMGFENVKKHVDIHGRDRMVSAVKI